MELSNVETQVKDSENQVIYKALLQGFQMALAIKKSRPFYTETKPNSVEETSIKSSLVNNTHLESEVASLKNKLSRKIDQSNLVNKKYRKLIQSHDKVQKKY